MKLQLALDTVDFSEACRLIDMLYDLVDIIEIGTPFIFRDGISAVSRIKAAYPEHTTLADLKIMDAGAYEAEIAFEAGADMVTVLGVAHDVTLHNAVNQARAYGRQTMADLIAVPEPSRRVRELETLGVDYICAHTATDLQQAEQTPLDHLQRVMESRRRAGVAVAGGITPERLRDVAPCHPDIVVVGSYITVHADPRQAALAIRACFP